MFASKVAKPQTKATSRLTNVPLCLASTAPLSTQSRNKLGHDYKQEAGHDGATRSALRDLSWSFGEIPIYPPGRTARPETPLDDLPSVGKDSTEAGPPETTARAVPDIVRQVLRSPGQPLDAATKGSFESSFRHTLPDMRVHSGAQAEESAGLGRSDGI
jgi:hypothetical protein